MNKRKGRVDQSTVDIEDRVVHINRVTKVVKGGRNISFSALVVVGDRNGSVGVGLGKATEIADAIRKGKDDAQKNMFYVPRNEHDSVFHQIVGEFGASKVIINPASEGTGIAAGAAVRAVMELAGIRNVTAKAITKSSKRNILNAVENGLKSMKTPEEVARLRGKAVEEILG